LCQNVEPLRARDWPLEFWPKVLRLDKSKRPLLRHNRNGIDDRNEKLKKYFSKGLLPKSAMFEKVKKNKVLKNICIIIHQNFKVLFLDFKHKLYICLHKYSQKSKSLENKNKTKNCKKSNKNCKKIKTCKKFKVVKMQKK